MNIKLFHCLNSIFVQIISSINHKYRCREIVERGICFTITTDYISVSQGGMQVGCSPPWKIFSGKNLKGGTKVKIYPPLNFLRNLSENLKGGTKGNFDLTWVEKTSKGGPKDILTWLESRKTSKGGPKEIFWTKFRNFSQKCFLWSPPLRFQ
jgi:hypothetical protein